MKTRSLISLAVAAATLAVSSAAMARDDHRHQRNDGPRAERQVERHGDRHFDRRGDRHVERHVERHVHQRGPRQVQREVIIVNRNHPAYQSGYRNAGPRWQRGQYLPREYRGARYAVQHRHPQMYAAPRGHQWVSVNGEFLLIAAATGLIAHAIFSN